MNFRRSDFYAPLAALFLSLVVLMSTSAALDQASDSLERMGKKFTETHKSAVGTAGLMLAGISNR